MYKTTPDTRHTHCYLPASLTITSPSLSPPPTPPQHHHHHAAHSVSPPSHLHLALLHRHHSHSAQPSNPGLAEDRAEDCAPWREGRGRGDEGKVVRGEGSLMHPRCITRPSCVFTTREKQIIGFERVSRLWHPDTSAFIPHRCYVCLCLQSVACQ